MFAATPGLNVSPNSITEIQTSFAHYFPNEGSYKNTRHSWFDPVFSETFLNEITRRSSEYRDQYMVDLLARHVMREGQRVLAVVGGSHVVMQENGIRSLLR